MANRYDGFCLTKKEKKHMSDWLKKHTPPLKSSKACPKRRK